MSLAAQKAKSSWLLAFGDVITLLITFFILIIVLNKGEITKIQKWTDDAMDHSFFQLSNKVADLPFIHLERNSMGIVIKIDQDGAFERGGFNPSKRLVSDLSALGGVLTELKLFNFDERLLPYALKTFVKKEGLKFRTEISVSGHTDDDPINPYSSLKNNWFLSTMRAQGVMRGLQQASQLNESIFAVSGYGEYRPIASNLDDEGKALNRRVEVVITATFEKSQIPGSSIQAETETH